MTKKCPACGSGKIIPNVYISGEYHVAFFEGNPAAFMLKERKPGKYVGELCGDCGIITLRAEDPAKLWEEYQKTVEGKKNATAT